MKGFFMNMNRVMKNVLAAKFVLVAGFMGLCGAGEAKTYEEFARMDQPFMFFTTFGNKPCATFYHPAMSQLNTTFLGYYDQKTKIGRAHV
jgi:hypothetical protein